MGWPNAANQDRLAPVLCQFRRRSQVAKAADCKSAIVGPTPTGASDDIVKADIKSAFTTEAPQVVAQSHNTSRLGKMTNAAGNS